MSRSYRIEYRRDYISGFDWQLRLTGQPVGGYARMNDGYGGKYYHKVHARQAGEIWNELGLIPAMQTDERIEIWRQARVAGAVKELEAAE